MLEKTIQKHILEYLHLRGVFCWRNNSGGFYTQDKDGRHHCYRYGAVGSPDIMGLLTLSNGDDKIGVMLGIEVKRPDHYAKLTDAQKDFIARINQHGGLAFMAQSIEDVDRNFLEYGEKMSKLRWCFQNFTQKK